MIQSYFEDATKNGRFFVQRLDCLHDRIGFFIDLFKNDRKIDSKMFSYVIGSPEVSHICKSLYKTVLTTNSFMNV